MREAFIAKTFRPDTLDIIDKANAIIADYVAQGFRLTLRQLYYQFVARGLIANSQANYKRLGSILNDARLAGYVDWDAIEDRTRFLRKAPAWGSPQDIVEACANQYKEDLWADQPAVVEVWIEKDALIGVIEGVCTRNRVPYLACRGYASQSELYSAGKRLAKAMRGGRRAVVLHLGDHDPSGLDMTRDNSDRLDMFSRMGVDVRRLALNMDQVEQYDPPPNPAKETDSRSTGYIEEYGASSWELDALEPTVIDALVQEAIDDLRDDGTWQRSLKLEATHRAQLASVAEGWDDIVASLR